MQLSFENPLEYRKVTRKPELDYSDKISGNTRLINSFVDLLVCDAQYLVQMLIPIFFFAIAKEEK
jgi:hypothetical protein